MRSREQISEIIKDNANKCQDWRIKLTNEEVCYTLCNQVMKQNENGKWFETWNDKDIKLTEGTWEKQWEFIMNNVRNSMEQTVKHNSRVINIECPYKGKHKYDLNTQELKDYERIKKQIQRAKVKNTPELDILIADFKSNLEFVRQKNNGEIHISFSGGKDSTILLNMVRILKKQSDKIIVNVFAENFFSEIAAFIQKQKKYGESIGEVWKIQSTGWNLWKVWKTYGWFGHSKMIMRIIGGVIDALKAQKGEKEFKPTSYKSEKYKHLTPSIENHLMICHNTLKTFGLEHIYYDLINEKIKLPNWTNRRYQQGCCMLIKGSMKPNKEWRLTGMRAAERNRKKIYCVDKTKHQVNIMKNWTDKNEQTAIRKYHIEICKIYKDKRIKRTGCVFCPFGGQAMFNLCCNRYENVLNEEQKEILNDMKKAREYFKPRYEN